MSFVSVKICLLSHMEGSVRHEICGRPLPMFALGLFYALLN